MRTVEGRLWGLTLAAAASLVVAGCGPETASEYADWTRDATEEERAKAWYRAEGEDALALADGLAASAHEPSIAFLVTRLSVEGPSSPAGVLLGAKPADVGPALLALADPTTPERDREILAILNTCCDAHSAALVDARLDDALTRAESQGIRGTQDATLQGLRRSLALLAEGDEPVAEAAVQKLASALDQSVVREGGGCSIAAALFQSRSEPVQAAAERALVPLAEACLAPSTQPGDLRSFASALLSQDAVPKAAAKRVIEEAGTLASFLAEADEMRKGIEEAERLAAEAKAAVEAQEAELERQLAGVQNYSGWIIGTLGSNTYEVADVVWDPYLGRVPSSNRMVLVTTETTFTTTGHFSLWVERAGTETITLQNGFTARWPVLRERADAPRLRSAMSDIRSDYDASASQLRHIRQGEAALAEHEREARVPLETARTALLRAVTEPPGTESDDLLTDDLDTTDPTGDTPDAGEAEAPDDVLAANPPTELEAPRRRSTLPSLDLLGGSGPVDLGERIAIRAELSDGGPDCTVRVHYLLGSSWKSDDMLLVSAGTRHEAIVLVQDEMGDALQYYVRAECPSGATQAGSTANPVSRSIL